MAIKSTRFHDMVKDYEKEILSKVLNYTNGNQKKAARILGLRASSLSSLLSRLNVNSKSFKKTDPEDSRTSLEKILRTDFVRGSGHWTEDFKTTLSEPKPNPAPVLMSGKWRSQHKAGPRHTGDGRTKT